ncbi:MAG: DUF655 domain-containing protein [Candidatus Aenigmarchaeota archaeon]|nr:DUF655 domain-containing protein [Candidatus Aenigmarchaeota archaeon]
MKDEYGIVLDFLHSGHSADRRATPIAQVIGDANFNLLEVELKEGHTIKPLESVYIGTEKREVVKSIKKKLTFHDLTGTAQNEIDDALEIIINTKQDRFIEFFNKSGPLTTRQHQLELLPGIGKKHMWEILDERKKAPFESFEDIKERVKLLPNPKKSVIKRIIDELEGDAKWYLFTTPPKGYGEDEY